MSPPVPWLLFDFTGIPFAQPPLNNHRFKPPQPVNNWGGILDATTPVSNFYINL